MFALLPPRFFQVLVARSVGQFDGRVSSSFMANCPILYFQQQMFFLLLLVKNTFLHDYYLDWYVQFWFNYSLTGASDEQLGSCFFLVFVAKYRNLCEKSKVFLLASSVSSKTFLLEALGQTLWNSSKSTNWCLECPRLVSLPFFLLLLRHASWKLLNQFRSSEVFCLEYAALFVIIVPGGSCIDVGISAWVKQIMTAFFQ